MSQEHVTKIIAAVLAKTQNHSKNAEHALRQMIAQDKEFLALLVEPYLGGILAHAIDRARRPVQTSPTHGVKKAPLSTSGTLKTPNTLAVEPLPKRIIRRPAKTAQTLSTQSVDDVRDVLAQKFAQEPTKNTAGKASSAHIQTLQTLAKKKS